MDEPQNAGGVAKLFAPPFKTYVETTEVDKKTKKTKKTRFTCYLHPLTEKEQLSVEAVAVENLRAALKMGLDDNECWYRRNRAYICQRLFYSIRTGSDPDRPGVPGSHRLFDERMVVLLAKAEVDGFAGWGPAIDHLIHIQPRAGFEHPEGGGVPSE